MPVCIDLFSGCGGLSLGLGRAGFNTLFGVEAHADAFATYEQNLIQKNPSRHKWPEWLPQQAWRAEELLHKYEDELIALRGQIDLIAGGPPCQGFTTNGLRRPDDPRSQMVDVYLNYVAVIQPSLVLLENVQGFRSMRHRSGGTYAEYVREQFEQLGYDVWHEIVKASDWGVPQRRPRFVLIAALKGSLRGINPFERLRVSRKMFLEQRQLGSTPVGVKQAISDLQENLSPPMKDPEWGHLGFKSLNRNEEHDSAYQLLMRAGCYAQPSDMRLPRHRPDSIKRMKKILKSCDRGVCLRPADRERLGIQKRSITPLDPDAPSPTISTLPDDFIHYDVPRSMTVREHARIQSFPDWFSFKGPYTSGGKQRRNACPKYTQVGNAVPPLLAEGLGECLRSLRFIQTTDDTAHLPNSVEVHGERLSQERKIFDRDLAASG